MEYPKEILEKWVVLIQACKDYYIDSRPTGISDQEFDDLERRAIEEDKFYARDYVFDIYYSGQKTKNSWIEKINKVKVPSDSTMIESLVKMQERFPEETFYCDLKYDGSSLAIYLDPSTGKPLRIVTVGNLNLDNYGVDQTSKLIHFLPPRFPKGIVAIQAEALIDLERLPQGLDPERARQKANGLINSKFCEDEINEFLTIRAYRYYTDDSQEGRFIKSLGYRNVLEMFEITRSEKNGHIMFSPADSWTVKELVNMINTLDQDFTERDRTQTSSGFFLNDGWVVYNSQGVCECALKYASAGGNTEIPVTTVRSIQWNSQVSKGKDSWSANVIIDPVTIKGCTVKKPSAGSVGKLVKNKITPGAEVTIVLANSTIPMVGEVKSQGDGNFMWPICSCGYQLSETDVYGSNLKCGNKYCSERKARMEKYLSGLKNIKELDLNKYLVIDRFKWEDSGVCIDTVLGLVELSDLEGYLIYLGSFMKTDLQKRNFNLIGELSFIVLRENYEKSIRV